MKTTVKHPTKTTAQLTIALEPSELEAAEQVALKKLSKDLKVSGFRKGKVPISVAAKHVDPNALQEQTLEDALSKAVAEAFIEQKIQALERPQVEVKKFVPGKQLEFTAEAQVIPKIKLANYKKMKSKRQSVSVTAKDVDQIITNMQKNLVEKSEVKRAAKNGDEAIIDFTGKKDGVAFDGGSAKEYALKLGEGQFIPGFEEGVVGHKAGDKFDLELEFPKDYLAKELAGQKVVFEVKLHKVNQLKLPEINDEFAAKIGPFTDVKQLKDDIKREITAQKEQEADQKLKDDLVEELAEISDAPLPELLVEDQVRSIEQDVTQNLLSRGMTLDNYLAAQKFKDKQQWQEKEVRPTAEKRVKAGLVLAELSKELKIDISRDELAARIDQMKQQYGNDPKIAAQFDNPEVHRDIANSLISEKTIAKLMEINQ